MSNAGDIYDEFFIEIQMVLRRYQMSAARVADDPAKLLELRREENAALLDLINQQKRALQYQAGEPVEPQTLFAKVVMPGVGGGPQ